jgi:hypothetical protein
MIMKKLTGIIAAFFCSISLFAQSIGHMPNTEFNFLLLAVDNIIKNDFTTIDMADIEGAIIGAEGNIKKDKDCFIVRLTKLNASNKECTIQLKNNKTGAMIKSYNFPVKRVSEPITVLGFSRKSEGKVTTGSLAAERRLITIVSNANFNKPPCIVQKFTVIKTNESSDPSRPYTNNGEYFDEYVIKLLSSAQPGDVFKFYDINSRCSGDSSDRKVNNIIVFVK